MYINLKAITTVFSPLYFSFITITSLCVADIFVFEAWYTKEPLFLNMLTSILTDQNEQPQIISSRRNGHF